MYAREVSRIATPVGTIEIVAERGMLQSIRIAADGPPMRGGEASAAAADQLRQWFAGERRDFDLPLAPMSGPRGEALRAGLVAVPYGETLSYGALANKLDSGARAIGQLCARNPFPIVIPCHRVTAAGGKLGNYSGGDGPKTKSWLLDHEQRVLRGTKL